VSRIPKYADDYRTTEDRRQGGGTLVNLVAGVTCLAVAYAALRFFGLI